MENNKNNVSMLDAPRLHAIKLRQQLKTYQRIIRIFFPLFCLLSALGCGYTIQGKASLPFRSVSIGQIVNKTYQPKLEDKLQTALVAELMKNGIALENGSAYRIEGVITTYQLNTLAAAAGTAVEYEVIIRGDFKLVEPSGKIKALKGGGVFIVSFSSQGNLEDVIALRDQAIERALKDLSTELVISLIYP